MDAVIEHKKLIRKNALWLFSGQIIGRILRTGIIVYAARLLTKEDWGAFNYTLSIITLLTAFADVGISIFLTREANKYPELKKQYISTAFFIKSILIIFLSGIFIVLSRLSPDSEVQILAPIMIFAFIFDAIRDFGLAIARANERMEKEGLNNILTNTFVVVLGFALLYFSPSATSLALAYALGTGFGLLSIIISLYEEIIHIFRNFNRQLVKKIMVNAWPFGIIGLMGIIMTNTDMLMIKWLLGLRDVALYSAPQKLIQLLYIIPGFLSSAFFPALARHTNDNAKFAELFRTAISVVFMVAIPLSLGGVVLAAPIINFLYGPTFLDSVLTFRLLALTVGIVASSVALSNIIYAHNKERGYLMIAGIGIIANLVLDFLLIPVWGIEGSAIATLLSQILISIYAWHKARQICAVKVLMPFLRISSAGMIMGFAAYAMSYLGFNVLLNIALSGLAYLSILILIKEESLESFWGFGK